MTQDDFPQFSQMIDLVSEQYGKRLSPELIKLYFDGVSHLELSTVRDALNRCMRDTEHGQFMPKIADIIRMAEGSADEHAFKALAKVKDALERHGTYQSVRFDDPLIMAVIHDMGGWVALGQRDSEEWANFGSKEFTRRYNAYRLRGDCNAPGYLPGFFEQGNSAKGYKVEPPVLVGVETAQIDFKPTAMLKKAG